MARRTGSASESKWELTPDPVEELSRAPALQKARYIESVMREEQIQSVAFRNAELDSERLRIFGVIGFFSIFMLITVVRVFVIRTASGTASWRSLVLDPRSQSQ